MKYLFAVFVASLVGLLGLYLGVLPTESGPSVATSMPAPTGEPGASGAPLGVAQNNAAQNNAGAAATDAGAQAVAAQADDGSGSEQGAGRLALSFSLSTPQAPGAATAAGAAAPANPEPQPAPVLTVERSLASKEGGAAAAGSASATPSADVPAAAPSASAVSATPATPAPAATAAPATPRAPAAPAAVVAAAAPAAPASPAPAGLRQVAPTPSGAAVLTVTVISPQASPMAKGILADGNVVAWQEAVVGAESQIGRLTQINAQVGDRVRRGQVLAVGSTELAQAELAQLEAAAEEAKAALTEAAANAQRARDVKDSGALSPQQVGQYLTAERTAQARWSAQSAAVEAQRVRIRNSTVRAPDDGTISSRSATVGAVVPPGAELFRLIRQGRLEWRAEINGTDLSLIKPGQKASVQLPGGEPLQGVVRVVSPVVDPTSRRGVVYVDLPNPGTARPGLFAKGGIELGSSEALTLPRAAVLLRDGFYWVFTVGADNRVTQAKVSVGRNVGDRIEVTSGLAADARVVAGGTGFLSDGDVVRVVQGAAASGS